MNVLGNWLSHTPKQCTMRLPFVCSLPEELVCGILDFVSMRVLIQHFQLASRACRAWFLTYFSIRKKRRRCVYFGDDNVLPIPIWIAPFLELRYDQWLVQSLLEDRIDEKIHHMSTITSVVHCWFCNDTEPDEEAVKTLCRLEALGPDCCLHVACESRNLDKDIWAKKIAKVAKHVNLRSCWFRDLKDFEHVQSLTCTDTDLEATTWNDLSFLTNLHINRCSLTDLSGLSGLPSLQRLTLENVGDLENLSTLKHSTLQVLSVRACEHLKSANVVDCCKLERFRLKLCGVCSFLQLPSSILEVEVTICQSLLNLSTLKECPRLTCLALNPNIDHASIRTLSPRLECLHWSCQWVCADFSIFEIFKHIRFLDVLFGSPFWRQTNTTIMKYELAQNVMQLFPRLLLLTVQWEILESEKPISCESLFDIKSTTHEDGFLPIRVKFAHAHNSFWIRNRTPRASRWTRIDRGFENLQNEDF